MATPDSERRFKRMSLSMKYSAEYSVIDNVKVGILNWAF